MSPLYGQPLNSHWRARPSVRSFIHSCVCTTETDADSATPRFCFGGDGGSGSGRCRRYQCITLNKLENPVGNGCLNVSLNDYRRHSEEVAHASCTFSITLLFIHLLHLLPAAVVASSAATAAITAIVPSAGTNQQV